MPDFLRFLPMLAVAKLVDRKEVEEMASRGMSDINSSNVIGTYEKSNERLLRINNKRT